jgi:hypothetical protein
MLRETQMTDATNFLPCFDIETRKPMWVAVKNGEQLGVYDCVTVAAAFRDRYSDEIKIVDFQD